MEYAKEGDIDDGNDEYTLGNDGNDKPLAEGNDDDDNDNDDDDNDDKYTKGVIGHG